MAYFCSKTGVRIAAPGVSKAVDPVNGQDEVTESEDGKIVPHKVSKAEKTESPAAAERAGWSSEEKAVPEPAVEQRHAPTHKSHK
jgi:hypothetical protein